MLTTNQKGAIAEAAITKAAFEAGIEVYRPAAEGGRYDLIFGFGLRLLRIQCKWACVVNDVVVVRAYSCRRAAAGLLKRTYTAAEIDGFAVYCAEVDRCYYLPIELLDGKSHASLRLSPTRNNQSLGVHWARDFEFGATLRLLDGPIAQLGERLHGMQEAGGSSPPGSTL